MSLTATPKERFHLSEANKQSAKDHLTNPAVRGLLDVAMAEFCRLESLKAKDLDRGARIEGAHFFVNVLLGLAKPDVRSARQDRYNLPQPD